MNWEHLLHRVAREFYVEFFTVGYKHRSAYCYLLKKNNTSSTGYLALLTLCSLIQWMIVIYDELKSQKTIFGKNVSQNSLYPYLIIELSCCLLFIRRHIHAVKAKK